jgi:hypothetical protein
MPVPPHVFSVGPRRLRYARFDRLDTGSETSEYHAVDLVRRSFAEGLMGGPLLELAAFEQALDRLLETITVPVEAASLVLPDDWVRVTFMQVDELPRDAAARDEVIRWKMKKLVPFRVDELRLSGLEVEPLPDQEERQRHLLSFALDTLLQQLETIFSARGIRLGQIGGSSLCLLQALGEPLEDVGLGALVVVHPASYTMIFCRRGEPVMHRHKGFPGDPADPGSRSLVSRDLSLTRRFLDEQVGEPEVQRVILAAPEERREAWSRLIEEGTGRAPEAMGPEHLPVPGEALIADWHDLGPLLGAASREVA